MTKEFLETTFAGESMAHLCYLIFAEKAEKQGRPNLARLFAAIAYAEQVHATKHYRELARIKGSVDNLQTCIDGETHEVEKMYPVYHNAAEFQKESGATRSIHYALEAEKIHAVMDKDAKKVVEGKKDIEIGEVSICPICGDTVESETPEFCPVCEAARESFRRF